MPMREREDKDTQGGINRLRDPVKLRSLIETAKFRLERRLRVYAKIIFALSGFLPRFGYSPQGTRLA